MKTYNILQCQRKDLEEVLNWKAEVANFGIYAKNKKLPLKQEEEK